MTNLSVDLIVSLLKDNKDVLAIILALCAFIHTLWRASVDRKWRSTVEKLDLVSKFASENVKRMIIILERETRSMREDEPELVFYDDANEGSRVVSNGISKYTYGATLLQNALLSKERSAEMDALRDGASDFAIALWRMREDVNVGVLKRRDVKLLLDEKVLYAYKFVDLCSFHLNHQKMESIAPMSKSQSDDIARLIKKVTGKHSKIVYKSRRVKVRNVSEIDASKDCIE